MLPRRTAIWMSIAIALCACANSRRAKSSETHFLALCRDDACGPGLRCVCGVCTLACVDEGRCGELADRADCSPPAEEACTELGVCDVECERDADCAHLSTEHTCQAGRCRAPLPTPPASGGRGCEYDGVSHAEGEVFVDSDGCNGCVCRDGSAECTLRGCPPDAGVACVYDQSVYQNGERFPARDGCNQCTCENGSAFCTEEGCESRVIDTPPCEPGSCEYYGVCYPPGSGTEDGCCGCATEAQQQAGAGSGCIEPGWCPGRPDIGSRCGDMTMGCAMGLTCRGDFFGERPICTRSCNYGCPTGSECVEQVPSYDGGMIERMCLRTCQTQADCAFPDASGSAGECDTVQGLDRSYCF